MEPRHLSGIVTALSGMGVVSGSLGRKLAGEHQKGSDQRLVVPAQTQRNDWCDSAGG
ncbi:conserved hypothetical protein [Xenorhabdus nematophila F1]|uniref:Uncharacterized protein n=1 Tax=Xenorhabdus nematophila (strain ATCC 19061 / DSM 3370 / CCUG 14189 / LMG 1036 / NCIMB 9965 / AN6) TaxID=406817 RepID=D3V9M5_XENNA|nr:hypothetical protein XNC1_1192 [Xenorhabdus nematophila ATCC 19061]CCW30412.1 conserved hypothetical protein [Xenorhabdus nematophila F1]